MNVVRIRREVATPLPPARVVSLAGAKSRATTAYVTPKRKPIESRHHFLTEDENGTRAEKFWIDRTGPRMIAGVASTDRVCDDGLSLSSWGCEADLPTPLMWDHGLLADVDDKNKMIRSAFDALKESIPRRQQQIGSVTWLRKTAKAVEIRAVLDDTPAAEFAWEYIKQGRVRTLEVSIHRPSMHLRGVVDGVRFAERWFLNEVSIVAEGKKPDNADCVFDIFDPESAPALSEIPAIWECPERHLL